LIFFVFEEKKKLDSDVLYSHLSTILAIPPLLYLVLSSLPIPSLLFSNVK